MLEKKLEILLMPKLQPQLQDGKRSYQVRQIVGHFLQHNSSNFMLKQYERSLGYQKCEKS